MPQAYRPLETTNLPEPAPASPRKRNETIQSVALGIYISVPFCRTKCSYCNFASDVFSRALFERYTQRVCEDVAHAPARAATLGSSLPSPVDSIYLGGGTPTLLDPAQLQRIFAAVRAQFQVATAAEITVECAPGTLSPALIENLGACGVNRVSLGVQSFVDQEASSVGRLHSRAVVLEEIARLRAAGIDNISVDLIAGLPHQTAASWQYSLSELAATGVPHASVYMLEVDEDSRLGRELIAGGTRYHAHFVPDDDAIADFYLAACESFNSAGLAQYEISNFARAGSTSRHNLKYWTRQPYLGFGVDAHSMLPLPPQSPSHAAAVRFATPDALEPYTAGTELPAQPVSPQQALEEAFFLGLRMNRGVDLQALAQEFGQEAVANYVPTLQTCISDELLQQSESTISLTPRGRLLSNEVFARFLRD